MKDGRVFWSMNEWKSVYYIGNIRYLTQKLNIHKIKWSRVKIKQESRDKTLLFAMIIIPCKNIMASWPNNSTILVRKLRSTFPFFQTITWLKEVSFNVWGPRSNIWCKGSSVSNMPFTFLSPKYSLLASSSPSCHSSCQRIATLISSSLTLNKMH